MVVREEGSWATFTFGHFEVNNTCKGNFLGVVRTFGGLVCVCKFPCHPQQLLHLGWGWDAMRSVRSSLSSATFIPPPPPTSSWEIFFQDSNLSKNSVVLGVYFHRNPPSHSLTITGSIPWEDQHGQVKGSYRQKRFSFRKTIGKAWEKLLESARNQALFLFYFNSTGNRMTSKKGSFFFCKTLLHFFFCTFLNFCSMKSENVSWASKCPVRCC